MYPNDWTLVLVGFKALTVLTFLATNRSIESSGSVPVSCCDP